MSGLASLRKHLTSADLWLLVAGLAGLVVFVWLLPGQHPDATADFSLGAEAAERRAAEFLEASGYVLDGLHAEVELRRNTELLMAAQRTLGRQQTVRTVQAQRTDQDVLPIYYWRVEYRVNQEEGASNGVSVSVSTTDVEADHGAIRYTVLLTQDGRVWNMEREHEEPDEDERSMSSVDRRTLSAVYASSPTDATLGQEQALQLSQLPDSVVRAAFHFERVDTVWQASPTRPRLTQAALLEPFVRQRDEMMRLLGLPADSVILTNTASHQGESRTFSVALPPGAAAAYAFHHLDRSAWDADSFTVADVRVLPGSDDRTAEVRLVRAEPLAGQPLEVTAHVTAGGTLRMLESEFPEEEQEIPTISVVADIAEALFFIVMFIVLMVAFFRRMGARLIDTASARVDGVVAGLLVAVFILLVDDLQFGSSDLPRWAHWGIKSLIAMIAGTIFGLFTGLVSGAADSLTRSVWARKLYAASLMRQGSLRNVFVGSALLRGVGLAGVLLGMAALVLLIPQAAIFFEERAMLPYLGYQPMVLRTVMAAVGAYFICLFVLLGIGTFVRTFTNKLSVFVPFVVLAMGLAQGAVIDLSPVIFSWLLAVLFGLVLAFTYWRFDYLTCVTGLFLALAGWGVNDGWLATASPAWVDVMLVGILGAGVLVVGLVGVMSGRTEREVGDYVPAYVEELTRQERMKRDLEIAHQVQESFLPKRMPQVEGLDIAAMCLAALEVGGDYYDFVELEPGRLAIVVGDVSGKGIQAAFYMTLTKGILQTLCRDEPSPAQVLRRLNTLFCENVPRGTFISMIYGIIDVDARTFTFARAGHNPVILKRSPSQESDMMQPAGLAIGLASGPLFDNSIEEVTIDLRMGDVLVFYTDGFSEAMNRAKELYSDERLAQRVGMFGQRTAAEILRFVSEDVHHFMEGMGRHDDMTMLVVKLSRRQVYRPAQPAAEQPANEHPAIETEPSAE